MRVHHDCIDWKPRLRYFNRNPLRFFSSCEKYLHGFLWVLIDFSWFFFIPNFHEFLYRFIECWMLYEIILVLSCRIKSQVKIIIFISSSPNLVKMLLLFYTLSLNTQQKTWRLLIYSITLSDCVYLFFLSIYIKKTKNLHCIEQYSILIESYLQ